MKIGIIVHSKTGNTYSVAQKLQEKLLDAGHSVNVEKLMPVDEKQAEANKVKLQTIPDIGKYDALIIGGPVWGFSVSPVVAAYLSCIETLQNKKIAVMTTQHFPFPWLGGNRAISQMKSICESKGAVVCGTGIVNWSSKHREKMINGVVEKLGSLF